MCVSRVVKLWQQVALLMVLVGWCKGLEAEAWAKIKVGGVHVERGFLEARLVSALREDAEELQRGGYFGADGLSKTSEKRQQFSEADRQTMRDLTWASETGDASARREVAAKIKNLRQEAARNLERDLTGEHDELTYNYYAPGASLGRHLDEFHEETKGVAGWRLPSRRSVTWLVYLNERHSGGQLRCYPRLGDAPVGACGHDVQVAWADHNTPVFLGDDPEDDARLRLYARSSPPIASLPRPFQIASLPPNVHALSTAPRDDFLDIEPAAGTLVIFDSIVTPHEVLPVLQAPRFALTGWFHQTLPSLLF